MYTNVSIHIYIYRVLFYMYMIYIYILIYIYIYINSSLSGKDPRANDVNNSRHSVALVTSLSGNGECGPLTVILPNGFLSDDDLATLRQKFQPEVCFLFSGRSSHFMNGDTVVSYYEEVLAPTFAYRRRQLAERFNS